MNIRIRRAQPEDIPVLRELIAESVHTLQAEHYSVEQREGALGTVFGWTANLSPMAPTSSRKPTETSWAVVAGAGARRCSEAIMCRGKTTAWLDPKVDPARIRAFFVHPAWARRGIGSQILQACETAAAAQGFSRLELVATLTGEPLYRCGDSPPRNASPCRWPMAQSCRWSACPSRFSKRASRRSFRRYSFGLAIPPQSLTISPVKLQEQILLQTNR